MAKTVILKSKFDSSGIEQGAKKSEQSIDAVGEATSGVVDKLDQMSGGAITAFKGIVSGAKTGAKAMFTLKGAIAATGVGLLVLAVGSLVSYFTQTQRGADLLDKAFKAIGTTVNVLIDRLSRFGEGLFEIIVNRNFSAGVDILKESFAGMGEEIKKEVKESNALSDAFDKLEKRKIAFIVTEQRLRTAIEASRLEAENGATSKIRLAAIEEAIRLENQLADEKIAIADEEARISKARLKQGESLNEDYEETARLEAAVLEIQAQKDTRLKELVGRQRALNAENARANEDLIEKIGLLERLEPLEQRQLEGLIGTEEVSDRIAEMQSKGLEKGLKVSNNIRAKEKKQEEESAKKAITLQEQKEAAKTELISKGFAVAGELAGDNLEAQKGIAATAAAMDTFAAVNKTLATTPAPYNIPLAIATGAFGLLQVKKILSTNASGGGAPSVGGGGGGISTPRAQEDTQRVPNIDALNRGVGGGTGGLEPPRAYVVNEEISDKSKLAQRIKDSARLN